MFEIKKYDWFCYFLYILKILKFLKESKNSKVLINMSIESTKVEL